MRVFLFSRNRNLMPWAGNILNHVIGDVLTVAFGCAGGVLGYLGFVWLIGQGFYALVLPGGLVGLVGGIPRSQSLVGPLLCGMVAIVAGLVAEYRFGPFLADPSFGYFLSHALELRPVTLLLIGIGGVIGFWVPFRRRERK